MINISIEIRTLPEIKTSSSLKIILNTTETYGYDSTLSNLVIAF